MNPEKVKSSIFEGIRHSLSICKEARSGIIFICVLAVVMRVTLPYLGILMPKVVLDQIIANSAPMRFLIIVGGMALLLVAVNYLKAFTDKTVDLTVGIVVQSKVGLLNQEKAMTMDYELMENPEFIEAKSKAEKAMYNNHAPAVNIPKVMVELLSNCFGFLLYAGTIALIHPLILLVLLATACINWLMLSRARRYMEATRDKRSKNAKKLDALRDTLRRKEAAKDIRLYKAFGWLQTLYRSQFAIYRKDERKVLTKNMHAQLVDALMILVRDGAAYAFLIYLVLSDRMTLGDFVFIFAAVGALAGWVSGILTGASDLSKSNAEMGDILAEHDFPDRMNTGHGISLPSENELPPSLELRNVGYTYPKAESPALRNVNISIKPGERIAIVGANGAGKTTLIKLLCGMYIPTEGEVLLSGNPVGEYNRDEYYTLFSAVFQDIHLMASGILENVSQQSPDNTDRKKALHCLKQTGLESKIDTLPAKEDTLLVRAVHTDAVELSGGEKQKLAMARALYKDAPVLILDEPTAALDPIAENEVYQKYAELTEGKTSIYISHRLASTRFCDRILLISNNEIAEQGSHDQLMAQGGIYANMFKVQASYYQDFLPDLSADTSSSDPTNAADILGIEGGRK